MSELKKKSAMFNFEIDLGGTECSSFEPRFAAYDCIVTEGDTLEELLENAVAFVSDQDGGSLGEEMADKDWMQELIREKFLEDYDPTPWCGGCGAMHKKQCNCGPIADNE